MSRRSAVAALALALVAVTACAPATTPTPAGSASPGASAAPGASPAPGATPAAPGGAVTFPATAFAVKVDDAAVAFANPGEFAPQPQLPTHLVYKLSNWVNGKGYKLELTFAGAGSAPTKLDEITTFGAQVVRDIAAYQVFKLNNNDAKTVVKAFAVADGKLTAEVSIPFEKGSMTNAGPMKVDVTLTGVPAVTP